MKRGARLPPTEELHPFSEELDRSSTREIVFRLHQEDRAAVEAVGRVLPSVTEAAERAAAALLRGGRLVYVGAGTSGRLGLMDAAECPPTFGTGPGQVVAVVAGGPAAADRAVEGAEDDAQSGAAAMRELGVGEADFVCGVSASGTTPFVLGALKAARRQGASTGLVTSNPAADTQGSVQVLVAPQTGAELVQGSTRLKAGTATKLILNAISTAAMVALGKVYRGRMIDLQVKNQKLLRRAERMIAELTGLGPEKSHDLLARADGRVKVAVAMHLTGASADEARALVERKPLRALEPRHASATRRPGTRRPEEN